MLNNLEHPESKLAFAWRKGLSHWKVLQRTSAVTFVLGLTALAMILSLQGWKSLIPAFDMLTYFDNAYDLLHHGSLPEIGDISSYGSFSPPGTSWLMAFGMLLFKDPRLYEKAGSALLYFGTLWGLFIIARMVFGTRTAYFATLLYGLSGPGLDYAGSLWPIGHPFFYVWMVYFALVWAKLKEGNYLALAGITWAIGMYVDMAIAPALFILPAIWLFFRPPIYLKPLLAGFLVSLLVWYPYLKFEAGRGFMDLRSQVSRQSIFPANFRTSWCDPRLSLESSASSSTAAATVSVANSSSQIATSSRLGRFSSLANRLAQGLLSNFNQAAAIRGGDLVLLVMVLGSLILLSVGNSWLRMKHVRLNSAGRSLVAQMIERVKVLHPGQYRDDRTDGARVVALSLCIPWLMLILLAEPGRPERFTWLWPLQVLVVSALTTFFLRSWAVPKTVTYLSQVLLLVLMLPFSSLPSRLESWTKNGWAGQDAGEKRVVDYLAGQLKAQGRDRASIGYLTFIYPFMAEYNVINPRYKVGAEFDLLFKYQHGIVNTTQCAEGFSAQDEYRIVETRPKSETWSPRDRFNLQMDDSFQPVGQFGAYQVFKRQ